MSAPQTRLDEPLYLAALETLAGPVVAVDGNGVVLLFNPGAERASGIPRDEILGKTAWHLIPPERREEAALLLRRILEGAELAPLPLPWLHTSGELVHLLWTYTLVHRTGEEAPVVIFTGVDVTRQQALEERQHQLEAEDALRVAREEALRSSEARFSGIVELASDAIITINERGRIVLFNQGAQTIFGYRPSEVLGEPLEILIPERYRATHGGHISAFRRQSVSARKMGERTPIAGMRKSGEEFPAEASILKLELEDETLFSVVLRDVTDQRRVEREQRLLAELGKELAASLDEGALVQHLAHLLQRDLGDGCAVILRAEPGLVNPDPAWVGADHGEDLLEVLRSELDESLRETLSKGAVIRAPLPAPSGDSEPIHHPSGENPERGMRLLTVLERFGVHSLLAVPLAGAATIMGVVVVVGRDPGRVLDRAALDLAVEAGRRTGLALENARLYRDVQRALQARDDVLGVVSHDLGNPLAAIFIGVEGLERARARRGEEGEDYFLTAIRQSAQLMQTLIHELLEVRRMEAGHLNLDRERQPIEPLLERSLSFIDPLAGVKEVRISVHLPNDPLPEVEVDGTRIQQVFSNLLGNAVKHTPEQGEIAVTMERAEGELHIAVRDSGPGISAEDLPQVFDRFWRAEKTGGKGLGLGLAIARGIVRKHGGRIWAESDPGAGATFRFTLPLPDPDHG